MENIRSRPTSDPISPWLVSCSTTVLLYLSMAIALSGELSDSYSLSDQCPPSFEKLADRTCELRTLYQFYNSPPGFGGLRTPLPKHRASFTPEQIDLGRYLFFDPILSRDKDLSCAHCHHPELGLSDGLPQSIGAGGTGIGRARRGDTRLPRSAPTLWNVGFLTSLFWDGRAASLQEQAHGPLFSEKEMANSPQNLETAFNDNATYRELFREAFRLDQSTPLTVDLVIEALAAFQSSLISLNSRYDRYAHGDESALTTQEQIGHTVFRSFVTRCSQCHIPPLFTNQQLAVSGAPDYPGMEFDPGAQAAFDSSQLRGAFRVPTLRNVALTAPYMHSGSLPDLASVVDFYNAERGHAVPAAEQLNIHWHIVNPTLSPEDQTALIAFLNTLTDETNMPTIPTTVPSGLAVVTALSKIVDENPNGSKEK